MDIGKLIARIKTLRGVNKASDIPVLGRGEIEPQFDIENNPLNENNSNAGVANLRVEHDEIIDEELPSVNRRATSGGAKKLPNYMMVIAFFVMAFLVYQVMNDPKGSNVSIPAIPPPPPIVNNMPPLIMPTEMPTVQPQPIPVQAPPPPPVEPDWVSRKVNSSVLLGEKGADQSSMAKDNLVAVQTEVVDDKLVSDGLAGPRLTGNKELLLNKPKQEEAVQEGELGKNLKPLTITRGVQAGILANRNYMITKGTALDCALETALDSTLSGMVTCRLTRDVYSDNGRVILLDRGSQLVGEYQSGMNEGIVRIFVLWTRAKTPHGVVVDLNSPATDALGRTGLEGYVDHKFIQRYGSAIMLSAVQEYVEYLKAKQGLNTTVTTTSSSTTVSNPASQRPKIVEDIAKDVLRKNTTIPPVLYINQGANVQVMVVRDLDFSKVYRVDAEQHTEHDEVLDSKALMQ
jgi:type IV secretion system protein VirB10